MKNTGPTTPPIIRTSSGSTFNFIPANPKDKIVPKEKFPVYYKQEAETEKP